MMWWCIKAEGEIENDDVVGETSLGSEVLEQHGRSSQDLCKECVWVV